MTGRRLQGTLAAAITPLRDEGETLDEDAFGSLADFFVRGGLDGILALGTTGEGIMLEVDERRRVAHLFVEAVGGRLAVAVHCGAQTTRRTAALAQHAAEAGADAVAVIAPPYYAFDEVGLLRHFTEAARACAPLPFYVYEFADRTGYPVPLPVIDGLRRRAGNLAGMKVSDAPFERFEPFLLEGLDVFVGPEALIVEGLTRGAVGAVSGLATAFPELVVNVVGSRDPELCANAADLRSRIQREFPMPSALKAVVAMRGVPVRPEVRAPLTTTDPGRLEALRRLVQAHL